jgi:ribosome maturation factor RimP
MPGAEEKIREVLGPILMSLGLDLWDLEFQKSGPKWLLRVYIDREIGGGVTLGDCESVSRDLSAALDVEDFIPHAYTLEVSSPGLDRALTKPEHFIRFEGQSIKIKTYQPIEKEKVFRGKLLGIVGTIVKIQVADDNILNVPLSNIAKASLEVEFETFRTWRNTERT